MGFLKLDIYVAWNIVVEIIYFFDHLKTFVTRTRPRDAEQLKEAFSNLRFDHEQRSLNSVTFSIPTIIFPSI